MRGMSRRIFLKRSGRLLGAAALAGSPVNCVSLSTQQGFRFAMCNESMRALSWREQCHIIGGAGFTGVEIAAFTLVDEGVHEISATRRAEMVQIMDGAGIVCAGLHWLLAPPPKGLHFTTPEGAVRDRTVDYFKHLIDFCADLGGRAMIFGSPKQRNAIGIPIDDATGYFTESLSRVADHAQEREVMILIEPLDSSQTDVVNTLSEALAVAETVDHPAVSLMFDFHNTTDETESFETLIRKYYFHIGHVHVQEMDGRHLGTGTARRDFKGAFHTLRELGYDRWVSLEVFDFTPPGPTIAAESMAVLQEL